MSVPQQPNAPAPARTENLALCFQELITAVVRLRVGRQQAPDAEAFRRQVLQAIQAADREARERGYSGDDIKLAVFATVAFLDETILNLRQPAFAEWERKPLQEELFGRHVAGEAFFQNLQTILQRRDTETTADVLEVYLLCILLGYLGRYAILGRGELRSLVGQIDDKIRRIRKPRSDLSPRWQPPDGPAEAPPDRWARRLLIALAASVMLWVGLYTVYSLSLSAGVNSVRDLAGGAPR